jgi:ABC-type Fe3+-siderophore transport system permease subunit
LRRAALVATGLAVVLVLGVLMGVALGPVKLDLGTVLSAIVSSDDPTARVVVWDLRLPRVAAALLVGSCLGLAGCLLQSSARNPLGDPQLFGLGGGAAVVQALAMAGLLRAGTWGILALSVGASLAGAGAIAVFASREGISPARLALIGVSISALAAAAATGILAQARVFSVQSLHFMGGSFTNLGWTDVTPALPFVAMGLVLASSVTGRLNVMSLGDRVAANLGAEPVRTRAVAIAASGILGGAAVAIAGLVGFVGLLIPHLARLLVGRDFRAVALVSIPLGAAFMLYADQAARLIFAPSEIPVGLVTALVGAPLMIGVARRVL